MPTLHSRGSATTTTSSKTSTENATTDNDASEEIEELRRLEHEFELVEDDDLAQWQQRVLERPHDGLRSLELLFASSSYDALIALSLPNNAIDDISPIVCAARTLRLLNLNANAITRLPSTSDTFWSKFQSLTLLFLAGNELASWRAMDGLVQCPKLLWLCVDGNPIMSQVNAREFLINKLPSSLKALNDHVVTDIEYIKHAGRSIRFGAQNVRLFIGDLLAVPADFGGESDEAARKYITHTERTITEVFARNSPTILTQRVLRGYVSRRENLPLFTTVRKLVVCVQTHIRGFLFRRKIRREFVELVTQQGQQDLLFGPMDDELFMTGGAHRGLRKLVTLVQQWRVKFRARKQAIAVSKIRFWCQMVYQRYRYRSQQLLKDQQEIFIYYTPSFENELLEMALKSVPRDPVLMAMAPKEREQLIRQRCVPSGVSVLRIPSQSRVLTASSPLSSSASPFTSPSSPPLQLHHDIQRDNAKVVALKKTFTPPLIRIFGKHHALETHVMVTQKHLIQQDLATLEQLKHDHRNDSSTSGKPATSSSKRAMLVHISQLQLELQQRLVIVNRKILAECVKQQQRKTKPRRSLALTHVGIRVRGYAPTRAERRKIVRMMPALQSVRAIRSQARRRASFVTAGASSHGHLLSEYAKMRVFIPWSIDMYMQMLATLDRVLVAANVSAGFALSYEQTRTIDAAVVIQSAWRAARGRCRRDALEATIQRGVVCVQRWWRHCVGLRRRLAFIRACVLTCGAINSRTLFMEEYAYRLISDVDTWSAVKASLRPCKEHALHCLMVNGAVEISLSPTQMMLYAPLPSTLSASLSDNGNSSSYSTASYAAKLDAASVQRCGAYLPVWLAPGTPEHFEESMVSREGDATPYLLMDHVHVEPTLIEREMMLLLGTSSSSSSSSSSFETENPYKRFAQCRKVASVGTHIMSVARKFAVQHRSRTTEGSSGHTAAAFVRLTFDSIQEARHRALVLLAKTFDPVTRSYAKLFSIEALVGAAMLRHQWAVTQAVGGATGDPLAGQQLLDDCKLWLQPELPSKWSLGIQRRLPPELQSHNFNLHITTTTSYQTNSDGSSLTPAMAANSSTRALLASPHRPSPPAPLAATASSLVKPMDGPTPIHLVESSIDTGVQPVPPTALPQRPSSRPPISSSSPSSSSSSSSPSFSRHQLLTDRLGKPTHHSLDDRRQAHLEDREYLVRDLREERERAMEALIVDKRMVQRDHAAELAGIHLEMTVKLQKIKYDQELATLATRELVEREKMNERKRKLTSQFEKSFVAQSGAMMRSAARQAVQTKLIRKEEIRKATSVHVKEREQQALERRQDAKSYCFVSNQKSKRDVDEVVEIGLARREMKETARQKNVRQRIHEDKEIKKMLRLI